jgi:hypothetical protein
MTFQARQNPKHGQHIRFPIDPTRLTRLDHTSPHWAFLLRNFLPMIFVRTAKRFVDVGPRPLVGSIYTTTARWAAYVYVGWAYAFVLTRTRRDLLVANTVSGTAQLPQRNYREARCTSSEALRCNAVQSGVGLIYRGSGRHARRHPHCKYFFPPQKLSGRCSTYGFSADR